MRKREGGHRRGGGELSKSCPKANHFVSTKNTAKGSKAAERPSVVKAHKDRKRGGKGEGLHGRLAKIRLGNS